MPAGMQTCNSDRDDSEKFANESTIEKFLRSVADDFPGPSLVLPWLCDVRSRELPLG